MLGNAVFHGANIVAMVLIVEKTPARLVTRFKLQLSMNLAYTQQAGKLILKRADSIA